MGKQEPNTEYRYIDIMALEVTKVKLRQIYRFVLVPTWSLHQHLKIRRVSRCCIGKTK